MVVEVLAGVDVLFLDEESHATGGSSVRGTEAMTEDHTRGVWF